MSRIPSLKGFLQCPKKECNGKKSFLRAVAWKDGRTERNDPRRLFGLSAPVVLVSRVYRCQMNHEVIAHDGDILMQLNKRDGPPRKVQTTISSYVLSGLTFSKIAQLLKSQIWSSLAERFKTLSARFPAFDHLSPSTLQKDIKYMWSSPSNDFIEDIFSTDFWKKKSCTLHG